ncbi:MAG: carbohydrate ABC transporter permease [Treponema sp.]|nr:carbohydrate ABC transporter permease [Treponema sp.]
MKQRKMGKALNGLVYQLFCIILVFVMLYPFLWLLSSAFKEKGDIFGNLDLIPKKWVFYNFLNGWRGFAGISFATFFKNSFIVTIGSTILSVAGSVFVGYGFSRVRFKGRSFWFACMMMTLMLPAQILMVPQYLLFSRFNWINTYMPLIIPYLGGQAFFIFLCVQFIKGIPRELDESAFVDGCGLYKIFWYIILPLTKSAVITSSIFSFYWRWSDFIGPLLYLKKPRLYTVSVALKLFADPNSITDWGALFAMSVLSLIPDIAVFLFLQKYLVEGISTTGIKG